MKKKIFSLLMAIAMLLSVTPLQPLEALAYSEEVWDGEVCAVCGRYNWGDWCCDNCGLCSEESINSDCYEYTHCADCGCCLANEGNFCAECRKCEACAIGGNDHCSNPDCFNCFEGDSGEVCQSCYLCSDCKDICDSCGYCEDCLNFVHNTTHCPICDYCFEGETDPCEATNTRSHCSNECQICEQCSRCLYDEGLELCDFCGLCPDCCIENAQSEGCECGNYCIEDGEWFDHICENCGTPFCSVEQCDICGFCMECCIAESECSLGMCVEDPDYEEHFCVDCGACFCDVMQCMDCEASGEYLCRDCCLERCKDAGCDCGNRCICDDDFDEHLDAVHNGYLLGNHTKAPEARWDYNGTQHWQNCKYCDKENHRSNVANHTFDVYGTCSVCGASKSDTLIILKQPKDVTAPVSNNDALSLDDEYHESNLIKTFSTGVYSNSDVTYQWQRKIGDGNWVALKDDYTSFDGCQYPLVKGSKTPNLKVAVRCDDCMYDIYFRCKITNKGGAEAYTKAAQLVVKHIYDKAVPVRKVKFTLPLNTGKSVTAYEDIGHYMMCHGDGCEASKKKVYRHHFGYKAGDKKKYVTDTAGRKWWVRTCTDCGYEKYVMEHDHTYNNSEVDYSYDSYIQHRLKCDYNGSGGRCEETTLEPHEWRNWARHSTPWTSGDGKGTPYRECDVCEHWSKDTLYRNVNGTPTKTNWTKSNDLVYVQYGSASADLVQSGDDLVIVFSPSTYAKNNLINKTNPRCTGWTVYYTPKDTSMYGEKINVTSYFTLTPVNGGKWKMKCTVPTSFTGWTGGGEFTFEPKIASANCAHTGATETVGAYDPVCTKSGYTGNTVCLECGNVKKYGEAIPGGKEHTGVITAIAGTEKAGTCTTYGYSGDSRCSKCKAIIRGKTTPRVHAHTTVKDAADATLTTTGYTGDTYCTDCGELVKEGKVVDILSPEVKKVEISGLTAPKENATPDTYVSAPEGAKYGLKTSSYPIVWKDETTGTTMTGSTKFVAGHRYSVKIPVYIPYNDYYFANYADILPAVNAKVDGKTATVSRYNNNSLDKMIAVTVNFGEVSNSVINEVKINDIVMPVAGKHPSYTATLGNTGYSLVAGDAGWRNNGIYWYDNLEERVLNPTDVFMPNHVYTVCADLIADTANGYSFATSNGNPSFKVYLNGSTKANGKAETPTFNPYTQYGKINSQPLDCAVQLVDKVNLSGITAPEAGKKPNYNVTLPKDAAYTLPDDTDTYTVKSVGWVEYKGPGSSTYIGKNTTFQKGKTYAITMHLVPKELDGIPIAKFKRDDKAPLKVIVDNTAVSNVDVEVPYGGSSVDITYIFPTTHSHSYGSWVKTENSHYKECSCGVQTSVGAHVYDNAKDTTCNTCGYVRSVAHTHSFNSEYIGDSTGHWRICTCGEKSAVSAHVYDNNADMNCNLCGYSRDNSHTHSYKTLVKDDKYHWHECSCGARTGLEAHRFRTIASPARIGMNGDYSEYCDTCEYWGDVQRNAIPALKSIGLTKTSFTYNGKVQKPKAKVVDVKGKTIPAKFINTVYFNEKSKNVGTYKVQITAQGDYDGFKVVTYKINPQGTTVSKLTKPKSKQIKVTWKKQKTQTTGYELQYSTGSKFTKKATKTVTVKKNKTTSYTLKKLKAKKKYYVRVRTYKTVGKTKYYSGWSKAKEIKTK